MGATSKVTEDCFCGLTEPFLPPESTLEVLSAAPDPQQLGSGRGVGLHVPSYQVIDLIPHT